MSGSVSQSVIDSFRFGDNCCISKLCELPFVEQVFFRNLGSIFFLLKSVFLKHLFFGWSDDSRDDGEEIKVTDAVKADIWGKI